MDAQIREEVGQTEGGLWGTLTRDAEAVAALYERLGLPARHQVLSAMNKINAAALFMERLQDTESAERALGAHIQSASPSLAINGSWNHLIVATPSVNNSASLNEMVARICVDVPTTVVQSEDDVYFCFEGAHLSLRAVAAAFALDGSDFSEAVRRVMTRIDVAWAPLECQEQRTAICPG